MKKRLACVGLIAALTACTPPSQPVRTVTVHTPGPATTSGATASSAAAASATPTPGGTEQILVNLFNADGSLAPGHTVKDITPASAQCDGPSEGGSGPNTFECGPTSDGNNACVQSQVATESPATVYCLNTPWTSEVKRFVAADLKPTSESPEKRPMAMQLTDGSRWRMVTGGAWSPPAGYGVAYWCTDGCSGQETLVVPFDTHQPDVDTSTPQWTVLRAKDAADAPPPVRATVAKAWFLQGRPDFRQGASTPTAKPTMRAFSPALTFDKPADVDAAGAKLSDSFKAYLRARLVTEQAKGSCHVAFTVDAWRDDGYARGGEGPSSSCHGGGGAVVYWAQTDGAWKEIAATQNVPECSKLKAVKFPSEMAGQQCLEGTQYQTYNQP